VLVNLATPKQVFASQGNVALLEHFTYQSTTMPKTVTTPFAIRAEVEDSKVSFMEGTFGTAASFRSGGSWHLRTFPDGDEVSVGDQ